MKKLHKQKIELPFEIGKTYTTRLSTCEKFTITNIQMNKYGEPTMYYDIMEQ